MDRHSVSQIFLRKVSILFNSISLQQSMFVQNNHNASPLFHKKLGKENLDQNMKFHKHTQPAVQFHICTSIYFNLKTDNLKPRNHVPFFSDFKANKKLFCAVQYYLEPNL